MSTVVSRRLWYFVATGALLLSFRGAVTAAELPPSPLPPKAEPGASRFLLFVSDLHMGVGHDPAKPAEWHPTEDFRWHSEFAAFLDKMHEEGKGRVDLVLVGDILELWQSAQRPPMVELDEGGADGSKRLICGLLDTRPGRLSTGDCDHPELGQDYGCNESEAVARAKRVVLEHREVFRKLGEFAMKGDNRVTIVPGNHDVALVFEGVRKLVLDAIPHTNRDDDDKRVRIATEGYWYSADGKVIAEHGQQIGADPNKFDNWPTAPFHPHPRENPYLKQPWGEELVQQLFNCAEHDYPTVDNLASEAAGVKYASRNLKAAGTIRLVGNFVRFLFFQNSLSQIGQFLDKSRVPGEDDLDLVKIKTGLNDDRSRWLFLAGALPNDYPVRAEMEHGVDALGSIDPLTDDEIVAVCAQRWARSTLDATSGVEPCPLKTADLNFVASKIEELVNPEARKRRFRDYLKNLEESLPATSRPTTNFELYVFGHTHKEEPNYRPFDNQAGEPVVYNDGAWQRTASEEVFCTILKKRGVSDEDALRKTTVEHLPPCYPFVTVTPDKDGNPVPRLFYWVQKDAASPGNYHEMCTELPEIHKDCKK